MKGRWNVYTCDTCRGVTVTIDVDEGVTPAFLDCRASGRVGQCTGRASSSFYPKGERPSTLPPPAWEWYRPAPADVAAMAPATQAHVKAGGLLIRRRAAWVGRTNATA